MLDCGKVMLYASGMNTPIEKACDKIGAANLARIIGVSPQAINEWKNGGRPIPLDRCVQIEQATNRAVTCEQLRPDKAEYWAYLRASTETSET